MLKSGNSNPECFVMLSLIFGLGLICESEVDSVLFAKQAKNPSKHFHLSEIIK